MQENRILLYHAGFEIIKHPDIHRGRKNADFGQGFYLSGSEEFARRWAKERRGQDTYINVYELDTGGLNIRHFERDRTWFECIYRNRHLQEDPGDTYDVITGPIANDTLYDTFGITTSGWLKEEQALQLLMTGPVYEQTVIRTEKAVSQLHWLSAVTVDPAEARVYREILKEEEEAFQKLFSEKLSEVLGDTDSEGQP